MKHIGNEIRSILRQKRIKNLELAKFLDCTPAYVARMLNQEDLSCARLEKIMNFLGEDPARVFDRPTLTQTNRNRHTPTSALLGTEQISSGNISQASAKEQVSYREKVALYERLLEEKERQLEEKERLIKVLVEAKARYLGINLYKDLSGRKKDTIFGTEEKPN